MDTIYGDLDAPHSMGTTIIGVTYDGGVVLGADSRTSTGMYVSNRASDKITQLTDNVYICSSGSVANSQLLSDYVRYYLHQHTLNDVVWTMKNDVVPWRKRYGKVPSKGPISVKLISYLLEIMVIETEEDKDDFKRLLNTMVFYIISVKSQGRVPRYLKQSHDGVQKKSTTCMVQVLEAWFNMRTGLIQTEDTLCTKDRDELVPILTYLGKKLTKVDAGNYFQ